MEMSRAIDLQKDIITNDTDNGKGLVDKRILGFRYFSYGILCYKGMVDTMMKNGFEQDVDWSKMESLNEDDKRDLIR